MTNNTFRIIECCNCNHAFMWLEGCDGDDWHSYELKDTGVWCGRAVCPACSTQMAVPPGEQKGMPIDDPRLEVHVFKPV